MPALCSMLLGIYYAFNYAGIIGRGLQTSHYSDDYIYAKLIIIMAYNVSLLYTLSLPEGC